MLVSFLSLNGPSRDQGGVSTIDAQYPITDPGLTARSRPRSRGALVVVSLLTVLIASFFFATAPTAFAGQASSGDLFFYPCTDCHPVVMGPDDKPIKKLPNDFAGHQIKLVGHDRLGVGGAACLACHDDPAKNPGKLKTMDGTTVDIKGDVAKVCEKCHSAKYRDWLAGTHGKRYPKCTTAGCHDPHSPQWIYAGPLLPFVGTGFQARAVSGRVPFTPLASPPVAPPVYTPLWFALGSAIIVVIAAGLIGWLIVGRART